MPAGAVIGALRVVLGADTAALDKGLKQAQSSVAGFGASISRIAGGVTLGNLLTQGINDFVDGIKTALTAADSLGKTAQKIGLPVEELSKLKVAAELANVPFENLTQGVAKFDKQLAEAGAGGTNDLTRALQAMGVPLRDANGLVKDQGTLLGQIADKFAGYADGANKSALAQQIFKKGGQELVPLLNQGSKGFEEAGIQAAKTGNIIDTQTAVAADRFNTKLTLLSLNSQGFANAVAAGALPVLDKFADAMLNASTNSDRFSKITEVTSTIMRGLAAAVLVAADNLKTFVDIWSALIQIGQAVAGGEFSKIPAIMAELGNNIKTNLVQSLTDAQAMFTKAVPPAITLAQVLERIGVTKPDAPFKALNNELQNFIDQTNKAAAATSAQAASVGQTSGVHERLRVQLEAEAIAAKNGQKGLGDYQGAVTAAGNASAGAQNQLQAANLVQSSLPAFQQYQAQLQLISDLYKQGGLSATQFAAVAEETARRAGQTWEGIGTSVAGTLGQLGNLTGTLAKSNKSLGLLSKAFGISQAIINTQIAITKALATLGPTPAGFAAIALAVATGAASIATIAAQNFAQGGAFRVPGGASLNDTRFVPLNLAAGERVDITPASEPTGTTVNIDLRGDQPFYSRATVERLANALHTVTLDGHNVQVVVLK
jgi:hypothetical protein